jgi:hypothetical protein
MNNLNNPIPLNDRAYLRSLGYDVGERGRFSTEMKDELAKRDYKPSVQQLFKPEVTPQREGRQLYGYDKEGNKIAFVICHRCTQHMVWCRCSQGVHAPKYIYSSKDPLVFIPPVAV